jgi:hypothetical protein
MPDQTAAMEQLERAERETPVCGLCGARTVPVAHDDGSVWLECASLREPKPALRRLLSLEFIVGHTQRLIVEPQQVRQAA